LFEYQDKSGYNEGSFITSGESGTAQLARRLAKRAAAGDVYCLSGQPGAGKTVFARGFAEGLGFAGRVTSPTFAILHIYNGAVPLYHFDLYRVAGPALYDTGFYDYIGAGGVCLIEWPENARGEINCPVTLVSITRAGADDDTRAIVITELDRY